MKRNKPKLVYVEEPLNGYLVAPDGYELCLIKAFKKLHVVSIDGDTYRPDTGSEGDPTVYTGSVVILCSTGEIREILETLKSETFTLGIWIGPLK